MIFPDEFVSRGHFILASGITSKLKYDGNDFLRDDGLLDYVVAQAPEADHYVGLETAGAILARTIARERGRKRWSEIKKIRTFSGERLAIKGYPITGPYVLIDDVITTGGTLEKAIRLIGHPPESITVLADRRKRGEKEGGLVVKSIFEVLET